MYHYSHIIEWMASDIMALLDEVFPQEKTELENIINAKSGKSNTKS